MNYVLFIARRISFQSHRRFTRASIRIALTAIVLSVSIMLLSDAIVIGFQREIQNKITAFAGHIQISKTSTTFGWENEPIQHSDSLVNEFYWMKPVRHVQHYATKPGIVKTADEAEGVVLKGIDHTFGWKFMQTALHDNARLELEGPDTSYDAIVSAWLANKLNLQANDTLTVFFIQEKPVFTRLRIAGFYETSIEEVDHNFLLCDIRVVRQFNNWEADQVGGYEIYLDKLDGAEAVAEEIDMMVPPDVIAESIFHRYPQLFDWLSLLDMNVIIILVLMVFVAAINMITALLIMILERTSMIGLFKALGMPDGGIRRLFVSNAGALIVAGILIGNLLALSLLLVQVSTGVAQLDPASYYVREVPVYINWWHFLAINAGSFVLCTLALVVPSMAAARVQPANALRFE